MEVVVVFIILYIVGEIFDKKKPTAPPIPMPQEDEDESERYQETLAEHERRRQAELEEKYKPREHKISVPLPMTDEKGEAEPDVYTTDANEVLNKYQQYAREHAKEDNDAYNNECDSPYDQSHKSHAHYMNRKSGLPTGNKVTLAQAIVLGEILGKPKAKRNMRFRRT